MDFMKKKDGKSGMGDHEKKAKLSVLKSLRKQAMDMMKDDVHGLKEVKVASNSKEGLEKGLDKAKSLLGDQEDSGSELSGSKMDDSNPFQQGGMSMDDSEESSELEDSDDMDESLDVGDECSEEELDEKIKSLMAKKEQMQRRG